MTTPYFERPLFFFDQNRFREALESGHALTIFKDAISAANTQFNRRFEEGEDIRSLIYDRALFVDCIVHYAWYRCWSGDSTAISLLAVGGYGRGELHPHSDIDLLILLETDDPTPFRRSIERFITMLWDIGLEVGQSVRSIDQCVAIAREDITVATNILECRTILGGDSLRQRLVELTAPEQIWPADQFFHAKWEEQRQRHAKHNNTEYNLEPNLKNSPGGLRDIQTINWVAKRYFGVRTLRQLEGQSFFTEEEFATLRSGEAFLWKVRYGLHILADRPEERLLFDYQRELATMFGYEDTREQLAIEQFMHNYYRIVLALGELNEVLMQFLDEAITPHSDNKVAVPVNERFQLHDGYIEVTHPAVFEDDPSALLEVFVLLGSNAQIRAPRASTIRLMRESRDRIDDNFRNDPRNQKLFMDLLRSPHQLSVQLERMKRYGILGRYLPEFGQVIGQMQHDLFHIYTVDAHTLLVVKHMRQFLHPDAEEKFPVAAHVMRRLPKYELLYIAGLYHDIAKGRGGDHSTLGAVDAQAFCQRHQLLPRETRLVCWLVENHLLMSQVSQKQDISDPEIIHNFAIEVGDQLHLDYLYALTVADMNATNPRIWNNWRASLLRQLYIETKRALRRGLEHLVDKQDIIEETQAAAIHKLDRRGLSEADVRAIWSDLGEDYFLREGHLDIAWHTEAIANHRGDEPLILIDDATDADQDGATQIFVRIPEHSNVFAAVATCLDQLNLSIQDARIYHTGSGFMVSTFYVLDQHGVPIGDDLARLKRIYDALKAELHLVDDYRRVIYRRTPRKLKHFPMPTRARINNDISNGYTVLEVISPDRPGLLARIGRIFIEFNIQLQNAKITTLGERVEDIFFITDTNGQPLSDPQLCDDLQREICRQLDQDIEPNARTH